MKTIETTPRRAGALPTAAPFLPQRLSLTSLRVAAEHCQGCELYKNALHVVFGEGPRSAALMVVGEVPGDKEDQLAKPFVGPAGKLLDDALAEVGVDRNDVYVTNAVKHFKWEQRGKRRLHAKPSAREISACRPWLEAEIAVVHPTTIVCLGATAAQALLGKAFRVTQQRGELLDSPWSRWILATYHPSAVLRAPTPADRQQMRDSLVADLRVAAGSLAVT